MFAPPSEIWVRLALALVCSAVLGVVISLLLWMGSTALQRLAAQTAYSLCVGLLGLQVASVPVFFAFAGRKPIADVAPLLNSVAGGDLGGQDAGAGEPREPAVAELSPVPASLEVSKQEASRLSGELPLVRFAPWVAVVYLAGVGVMLMRLLVALRGGQRLSQLSHPIEDPDMLAMIVAAVRRMKFSYTPAIAICPAIQVPSVVGIICPILLLPVAFGNGLTPAQVQNILMHELAHIRRWDPMVNLFQMLAEAMLFFNPGVWHVSRQIRVYRECCCDDMAAGTQERFSYAKSLLIVSEQMLDRVLSVSPLPVRVLGPEAGGKSTLAMRVRRLVNPPAEQLRLSRRLTTCLSTMTALVMIAMVYAAATALPVQGRPSDAGLDLVEFPQGGPASENLRGGEWPVLHRVAAYGSKEQVEMVLKTGINVNERAGRGWTALHFAVAVNRFDVVKMLLEKGADPSASNTDGRTPLHTAVNIGPPLIPGIERPNEQIVELLLAHGAKATDIDAQGFTPLHGAVMKGHVPTVRTMLANGARLEQRDVRGRPALHYAASRADPEMIDVLLNYGADVHVIDNNRWNALDHVAMTSRALDSGTDLAVSRSTQRLLAAGLKPDFCAAAALNLLEHVREHLARDPDQVNRLPVKTQRQNLALHWAALLGHEPMCALLAGAGADVNLANQDGRTALHQALGFKGDRLAIVQRLLDAGAEVNRLDSQGYSPLLLAVLGQNQPIVDLLLQRGANIHVRDSGGRTVLHALVGVAPAGPDLPGPAPDAATLLRRLLQAGANPNQADNVGVSPLHVAVESGRRDLADILLGHGANVNAGDNDGRTPLHRAVARRESNSDLIMLLLNNGADPSLRDSTGRSALDHASPHQRTQMATMLQNLP